MSDYQLAFPFIPTEQSSIDLLASYQKKLITLLSEDLNFHGQNGAYATHNFHAFPAKFPPQLPRKFITALTNPGDIVLDPMSGSGTTILEALLCQRNGIGFDIDPLAVMVSNVKIRPVDKHHIGKLGHLLLERAATAVKETRNQLAAALEKRWDSHTRKFIDYWFAPETQIELIALIAEIEAIDNLAAKTFFQLVFSATIITKSGGVSLARDLAHTRPHRAKLVFAQSGEVLMGHDLIDNDSSRMKYVTKRLRSPLEEFRKRLKKNLDSIHRFSPDEIQSIVQYGNAQQLPLRDDSIDLIVTSPPYASNAIDYMRAHKFSLAWMGYPINALGQKRGEYIGGEATNGIHFESLPDFTTRSIAQISDLDNKKGRVLSRYYSEMTRTLRELYRVLKPGKAAIIVVGSSVMRGKDTETATCLADIGRSLGFDVPKIGVRELDRNRRMMPAGNKINRNSQIQQRMHEEYIIGFLKPEVT